MPDAALPADFGGAPFPVCEKLEGLCGSAVLCCFAELLTSNYYKQNERKIQENLTINC